MSKKENKATQELVLREQMLMGIMVSYKDLIVQKEKQKIIDEELIDKDRVKEGYE